MEGFFDGKHMLRGLEHNLRAILHAVEQASSQDAEDIAASVVDAQYPAYRENYNGLGRASLIQAIVPYVRQVQQRKSLEVLRDNTTTRDNICGACVRNHGTGNRSCSAVIKPGLEPTTRIESWPYRRLREGKQILK